jgi:hypothetical protein
MFWEGAAEGRLFVEQCASCSKFMFPPRGICSRCHSRECNPAEITDVGRVYSYTVNYQPWLPGLSVPYGLILVEFDGYPDVRIFGRIRDCRTDELRIGMQVAIGFEPGPGGVAVPSFLCIRDGGSE